MFHLKIFYAFIAVFLSVGLINAQDQGVDTEVSDEEIYELFDVSLEEIMSVGMVSASKKKQSVLDAPAYAYVFTEEQIELRGYNTLLELLDAIPEVEIQRNSNPEYRNMVTFRGVPGSEKFLILQNGIRITPTTGDFYTLGHNYSLVNAKRVEVILGPASALYGMDAFSGVVNIITKNQEDESFEGGFIKTSLGNFGTSDVSFLAATRADQLKITLSGNRYHSEEPVYPDYYPDDYSWYTNLFEPLGLVVESPFYPSIKNLGYFVNRGARYWGDSVSRSFEMPTDAHYLNAEIGYRGFSFGFIRNHEGHSSAHGVSPKYTSYDRQARIMTNLNVFYLKHNYVSPDKRWNIGSSIEQSLYSLDPNSHFLSAQSRWQRGFVYSTAQSSKVQSQVQLDLNSKWNVTGGLSFENLSSLPRMAPAPKPIDMNRPLTTQKLYYLGAGGYTLSDASGVYDPTLAVEQIFFPLNYQIYGSYLQASYTPNRVLDFTLGGRIDYYSRYKWAANPRIGVVIKPFKKLRIKALYGTSILAPSPNKTFQQAGAFSEFNPELGIAKLYYFRIPNPGLEPEFLSNYELSLNYFITSNLSFSANGFYTEVYNLINPYGSVNQENRENLPLQLKGIQTEKIEISVNEGFSNFFGFTAKVNYLLNLGKFRINPYGGVAMVDGGYSNFGDMLEFDEDLLRPEDQQDDYKLLFYQSLWTVKAGLDISTPRLSFSWQFIWKDWSRTNIQDASGYNYDNFLGYKLLNMNARWNVFSGSKLSGFLFLKVNNLLDNRYYNVYVGNEEGMPITPQDPLRYNAGIQLKF